MPDQGDQESVKLRVPISALIDYKGFRCLAIGQIPIIAEQGPSAGFYKGLFTPIDPELGSALSKVGTLLHLKERQVASKENTSNEPVPISSFAKVYGFEKKQDTKLT